MLILNLNYSDGAFALLEKKRKEKRLPTISFEFESPDFDPF